MTYCTGLAWDCVCCFPVGGRSPSVPRIAHRLKKLASTIRLKSVRKSSRVATTLAVTDPARHSSLQYSLLNRSANPGSLNTTCRGGWP